MVIPGLAITNNVNTLNFPDGPVVKNPLANAGDTGSIPGPGRPHMLWSNRARVLLLSLCSRACAPQEEKPLQWEAGAPQRRLAPAHRN